MTTLFFLLLLIPLFAEIKDILNPARRIETKDKLKGYSEKSKELNKKKSEVNEGEDFIERQNALKEQLKLEKETKESLGSMVSTIFTYLLYIALLVIGMLMSSQWILFLSLFLMGLIVSAVKKISNNIYYQNIITVIDSTICATILLYIIINHFHHLDLIPLDLKGFIGMFVG